MLRTISATSGRSDRPSSTRRRYSSTWLSSAARSVSTPASSRTRDSNALMAGGDGVADT